MARSFTAVAPLVVLLFLAARLPGADWPHWRGPTRNDVTDEPSGWADGKWLTDRPAWTANVGSGASSPLVVGDRVFVVTGNGDGPGTLKPTFLVAPKRNREKRRKPSLTPATAPAVTAPAGRAP